MDNFYIGQDIQDSHHYRSRSDSRLSSTAEQLSSLNIESAGQGQNRHNTPDFRTISSPSYLGSVSLSEPDSFIPAPVAQQCTPFPVLSEEDLDPNWSYLTATEDPTGSAPILRVDPPESFLEEHHQTLFSDRRSIRSNSNPGTMSTLGIQQYETRFDGGMYGNIRHTFTWPGAQDMQNQQFISQVTSPGQLTPNLYDETKFQPMFARSLSSSPPRGNLSPEQRELKRQRDYARRDSKTKVRRERSSSNQSNPYIISQNTSPDLLPRSLPQYTNSLTPSPLLSQDSVQSSPALDGSSFLTSMSPYQPQINDQPTPDMFGPVYTMGPEFSTTAYISYPPTSDVGLQRFVSRPHSLSLSAAPDHQALFRTQQISPKMIASESGDHVRVVHSRPKPQCWEHGCNGRQFSTFSNLLRHQREKSGAAQKSSCPNCGAEFTRTTARNGHMAHDKCKARRNS